MPLSDSVLRCEVPVCLDGVTMHQILDSVGSGDNRCVVLEWGASGQQLTPKTFVLIPESDFSVASSERFELKTDVVIALDRAHITNLPGSGKGSYMLPPESAAE